MLKSRNIIKKIFVLFFIVLFGYVFNENVLMHDVTINEFNEIYLSLWERGRGGVFLLVFLFGISELILIDEYKLWYEKTYKNIVTRIGYRTFLIKRMMIIFFKSMLYTFCIHLVLIFLLNMTHTYSYMKGIDMLQHIYFSHNVYINLLIFVILSSIGNGILFMFLYTLTPLIKNIYVFRVLPLIVLFISIFLITLYSNLLISMFGDSLLVRSIAMGPIPTSLISPGGSWYYYALEEFVSGVVTYFVFMIVTLSFIRFRGIIYDW